MPLGQKIFANRFEVESPVTFNLPGSLIIGLRINELETDFVDTLDDVASPLNRLVDEPQVILEPLCRQKHTFVQQVRPIIARYWRFLLRPGIRVC
jgi:hypothetical protein